MIERPSSASKRARGPMEMREQLDYWRASWPAPNQSPMLTTYDLRPTTYDLRLGMRSLGLRLELLGLEHRTVREPAVQHVDQLLVPLVLQR